MRSLAIILVSVLTMACDPPAAGTDAVVIPDFEGTWYGIRPDGVNTFHSDSTFLASGDIVVRFFSCLSSKTESQWTDRGTWSWENDLLTITLVSAQGDDNDGESYTHQYRLLTDDHDKRTYRSLTGDYTFWLHRRWRDEPYDCTTTKADIDADRAAALASGRFQTAYPDYMETDQ